MKRNRSLKFFAKVISVLMVGITFIHHPFIWYFRERATRDAYKKILKFCA